MEELIPIINEYGLKVMFWGGFLCGTLVTSVSLGVLYLAEIITDYVKHKKRGV